MENITGTVLYNLGFLGTMREEKANIDGHYGILKKGNEFAVISKNGYGGLTYLGESEKVEDLTPSGYRFIHDAILKDSRGWYKAEENALLWESVKKYPLGTDLISNNVHYGDTVQDIRDGSIIEVNGWHDLRGINRNAFYQITNRQVEPITPKTKEEYLEALNKARATMWENWKLVETIKKSKYATEATLSINKQIVEVILDGDNYYIIKDSINYYLRSNILMPFLTAIDLLVGRIGGNHCIEVVETSGDYFKYDKFMEFQEEKSLSYNNAMTYF